MIEVTLKHEYLSWRLQRHAYVLKSCFPKLPQVDGSDIVPKTLQNPKPLVSFFQLSRFPSSLFRRREKRR